MESTQYGNERRDESTVGLVRGILEDVQTLTSKELTAAKLEIKQEITEAIKAAVAMGLGGFVSAIAFILLTLMIVLLLERYTPVPLWGSFGIVGLVYGIIGGVLIWRGKNRAADVRPYPQETVQSAKEDVRYLKQRAAGH